MKGKHSKNLSIAMFGQKNCDRSGGIEIVVTELATRMVTMGHEVTCYNRSSHHVSGREYDGERIAEYKGVHERYVPTIDKKGLAAVTSSFFAALACAFGKYDVVHIHAEGPAAMCWIPKFFAKRVIVTVHGLDWQRNKWNKGFGSKYIRFGEKCAVRFADEIIVLSREVQKYFERTYGRNTQFISNGVSRPVLHEAKLIKEKYGLNSPYLLSLSRLVPEKRIDLLIEAFKQIKTDKKLVIAGGSSDTDEYMKKLKSMASDDKRIIFTGFVQGEILEELFSNAYIYILPSDLEGMPLSLLEAMSYGNCCITSDIAECAEVVEDKAILFKKSDVVDLRNKIQKLIDDEALVKNYKSVSADFICRKYNWDDVTAKTEKLYRE